MNERQVDVFFYGLYMDDGVLRDAGVQPVRPRRAYVDDLELRIGRRAALVPADGARAYGMIFGLTRPELDRLYSRPGLEDYVPEPVTARELDGDSVAALCYNLRRAPAPEERDPEYAAKLRDVLRELGFPGKYVESVA